MPIDEYDCQASLFKGFAKASDIDIDSTVQKPDMQPPATANLLVKVTGIARRVQRPNRKLRNAPIIDYKQTLENRRAEIEPLIGHLKRGWQMGRSRMKSDKTTESSGY